MVVLVAVANGKSGTLQSLFDLAHIGWSDALDIGEPFRFLCEAGIESPESQGTCRERTRYELRGADEQVAALATRAIAHAALNNPHDVFNLLVALRSIGAVEQVAALATRAAAHTTFDNPDAVATLLNRLREVGADEQVTALATRLPVAGMFGLFLLVADHMARYRFGREPDGRPADRWEWEDL
ncbi:hypothetical protein [Actinomadura decatromicini]|uniref:Uncharacterized protein n=1 Tax=Actinomadura decatromicini TaxID=2604572 RepID=A0A5D3FZB9_9ACTN|nr:hypothetical protein [Actinomadura decatromicini]TYK53070.1 hypothetical protein FXF68_04905 [Actinomadura decatromicini]